MHDLLRTHAFHSCNQKQTYYAFQILMGQLQEHQGQSTMTFLYQCFVLVQPQLQVAEASVCLLSSEVCSLFGRDLSTIRTPPKLIALLQIFFLHQALLFPALEDFWS